MSSPRPPRRLMLAHDKVGGSTGMGKVAAFNVDAALSGGWRVHVLASEVDPEIARRCEVTPVPRPARGPQLRQDLLWYARVRAALRRTLVPGLQDVVHVHAPALLAVAGVMTSHHLSVAAHRRGVRVPGSGPAALARRLQRGAFMTLDEVFYRSRPAQTRMTFVSEFLRDEFRDRYGDPVDGTVITPPSPCWRPVEPDERGEARRRFQVGGARLVVGYLGGDDQRKGIDAVRGLRGDPAVELLVGGPDSERLDWPETTIVGYVDVEAFLPACDVVLAPALFDAAPTAVTQALARGIPVVVRETSGWAAPVRRRGAGAVWDGCSPLREAVISAARTPLAACRLVTEDHAPHRQATLLLEVYERALADRRAQPVARCGR